MGAGHPAVDVERGAGQPEAAGIDVAGVPPGATAGEGSRPGDADGGAVTRCAKSGTGKDAARIVSLVGAASRAARVRLGSADLSPHGHLVYTRFLPFARAGLAAACSFLRARVNTGPIVLTGRCRAVLISS